MEQEYDLTEIDQALRWKFKLAKESNEIPNIGRIFKWLSERESFEGWGKYPLMSAIVGEFKRQKIPVIVSEVYKVVGRSRGWQTKREKPYGRIRKIRKIKDREDGLAGNMVIKLIKES